MPREKASWCFLEWYSGWASPSTHPSPAVFSVLDGNHIKHSHGVHSVLLPASWRIPALHKIASSWLPLEMLYSLFSASTGSSSLEWNPYVIHEAKRGLLCSCSDPRECRTWFLASGENRAFWWKKMGWGWVESYHLLKRSISLPASCALMDLLLGSLSVVLPGDEAFTCRLWKILTTYSNHSWS